MPPVISPARTFKLEDVVAWFGEHEVAKGRRYLSAVSQLHVSDHEISALVQGTAKRPYTVRITFQQGRRAILAACTCPVASFCKHGAATMLAAIAQRDAIVTQHDPQVLEWVRELRRLARHGEGVVRKSREQLFYFLNCYATRVEVSIRKGRPLADGSVPDSAEPWSSFDSALRNRPSFVTEEDLAMLRLLWLSGEADVYHPAFRLTGRKADDILRLLAQSGRCYLNDPRGPRLCPGAARHAGLAWRMREDGLLHAQGEVDGLAAALVLPVSPPWYVDPASGECGSLAFEVAAGLALSVLLAPPLRAVDAALVARELADFAPNLPRPDTRATENLRVLAATPTPRLRLVTLTVGLPQRWRGYGPMFGAAMDFAVPSFDYGGVEVALDDEREFHVLNTEAVRLVRNRPAETAALRSLAAQGFEPLPPEMLSHWHRAGVRQLFGLANESAWDAWYSGIAPALRAAGWVLEIEPGFRHHVADIEHLYAGLEGGAPAGWFDLSLGFELDGKGVALAPLLTAFLREHPQWNSGAGLETLADNVRLEVALEDGSRVRFRAGRIKPVLRLLIDLFDGAASLRVSALDAPRLQSLAGLTNFSGLQAVQTAVDRLHGSQGVRPVAAPEGLGVTLRPYQLEGLAWLQHLREHDLAGILADDMGLGKTAQTLAHVLTEKLAGRLDRPALVVLPTSLVFNWRREAARIAPALSVLALHGPQRDFGAIPAHDVVLTTYPLVWRDANALQQHAYHLLILDEAQTVKNAASKAAGVVRELQARHRLCLTGTPMENHLGELWAQFDFLLPGFLGDSKDFTRRWRTPIEKDGDSLRRELLARRVKPFILRRRKDEVATELPPKTIMLRSVELEGAQRDLYEAVRSAMDEKVRDEIALHGLSRSQIVILDALLKLRQVCCDPRLLALPAAHGVKGHAKLDLLMQMLPELVEEGRHVLVFSQFTAMLALIEEALRRAGIAFATLTGDTRDRETPVQRFQAGEIPVFLISLKAGGVGLNLTRADTVIHFDPWWNPAAEEQATDRAHRIGQTRPVFVYKLIAAGSIEERIVALQEKKAALASAVLEADAEGSVKFGEDDLANLFAPLPEPAVIPSRRRGRPRGDVA